jgi:hypothetical protein
VLAAAIRASAQVIVTSNIRHFPPDYLQRFGIEARTPDDFVLDQIGINGNVVFACVQQIADTRERPPNTVSDILEELERRWPGAGRCRIAKPQRIATGPADSIPVRLRH